MCCRDAVERAFVELVAAGAPEAHAFQAGLFIYRYHHPEVPRELAEAEVGRWTIGRKLH